MNHVAKITLIVAGGAFATALATAAPHERQPLSIADAEAREAEHFAKMDGDGDGAISLAEFEAAEGPGPRGAMGAMGKHHRRMAQHRHRAHERHGDWQAATEEERAAMRERMEERRAEMRERRAAMQARRDAHEALVSAELFRILDQDGDGVVNESEFAGATREQRALAGKRAMFKQLDEDSSGYLSRQELPSRVQALRDADTDGDGYVSREEMRNLRRAMRPDDAA